jgi:hypothetical protein
VEHFNTLRSPANDTLTDAAFSNFFSGSHHLFVLLITLGDHPLANNLLFPEDER